LEEIKTLQPLMLEGIFQYLHKKCVL
jgi:hypothetical protein